MDSPLLNIIMCIQNILNSVGLFFDIIGILLIWKYGLPVELPTTGVKWAVAYDPNVKNKYKLFGHIGLCLIVVGFICQIVSNFYK